MFVTSYRTAGEINSAMIRVYQNMMIAVLISMVTSFIVGNTPMMMALFFGTPLKWLIMLAPMDSFYFLVLKWKI